MANIPRPGAGGEGGKNRCPRLSLELQAFSMAGFGGFYGGFYGNRDGLYFIIDSSTMNFWGQPLV